MKKSIFILAFISIFISCKDDEKEIYTQSARDAALAEQLTLDALKEVLLITPDFVINETYTKDSNIIVSATPDISNSTYPKTITIDYGGGVTGILGKERQGKLHVTINSGTVITENLKIEFDEYFSAGTQLIGSVNHIYDNGYESEILDDGLSLINANGTMKWNGTFSLTPNSNNGTVNISDDSYNFTCNTVGVDFSQTTFTFNSSTEHLINFACTHMITKGTSKLAPNGEKTQTVNFGTGGCDATAAISQSNGDSKSFTF
ncbi:hypothetical protein N8089_01590 [Flavobacteriales bacterium]|nr:hypothetical protein [Flavobacteriales bacterium]